MTTCRSCGAPVRWVHTTDGTSMPLDADPVADGNVVFTGRQTRSDLGVYRSEVRVEPVDQDPLFDVPDEMEVRRYRSHFASCPDADQWKERVTAAACPRCGSTERLRDGAAFRCDHPWHDRPTGADLIPDSSLRIMDIVRTDRMMQGVWPSTPGEATHALEDDPDPTGADDLAARLHKYADEWAWDDYALEADLRSAAARIRELEAVEDDRTWLRAELDDAIRIGNDLRAERDRLREAGDALAARLAAHPADVDDLAALDRWEQTRG